MTGKSLVSIAAGAAAAAPGVQVNFGVSELTFCQEPLD